MRSSARCAPPRSPRDLASRPFGWASVARGVPAVAGASLASLLALAFLSSIHALSSWSPAALGASVADLSGAHPSGVPWHAFAVTAGGTVTLVAASAWRLARRAS
jgi:hypothetical protein